MRILCLHGWRTSGHVLRQQTAGLRRVLGTSDTEWHFLDGTFDARGAARDEVLETFGRDQPYFEWWDAVQRDDGTYFYEGLEQTLQRVEQYVDDRGPFDVVLGFSQGAALTSTLTAHCQAQGRPIPWHLCVCVAGFRPRSVQTDQLFIEGSALIDVPSIHVVGTADPLAKSTRNLVDRYVNVSSSGHERLVLEHSEGHKFPTPSKHVELYQTLATSMRAVCDAAK